MTATQRPLTSSALRSDFLTSPNRPGVAIQIYLNTLKEKVECLEREIVSKDLEITTLKRENARTSDVFETQERISNAGTPDKVKEENSKLILQLAEANERIEVLQDLTKKHTISVTSFTEAETALKATLEEANS